MKHQGGSMEIGMVLAIVALFAGAMSALILIKTKAEGGKNLAFQLAQDQAMDIRQVKNKLSTLEDIFAKFLEVHSKERADDLAIIDMKLQGLSPKEIPSRPLLPSKVDITSKESVAVHFDKPIEVKILSDYRPPRVMPKPVKVPARKPAVKKKAKGK